MSRSEKVRQEVLERDAHCCQICRNEEGIEAHHICPLGMGGSEERDIAVNMISLCSVCHGKIHSGQLHIERWTGDELIVTDGESRRIPDSDIWFYRRQDAAILEKEIEMVRQVQLVESKHAEIMAHIWDNYGLVSDAASPEQFVAGLGLDSVQAKDEAKAARWIEKMDLQWPEGVNLRKVLLIASISILERKTAQKLLDQAVDMSWSDLRKMLVEMEFKTTQMFNYIVMPAAALQGVCKSSIEIVRTRDEEGLRQAIYDGKICGDIEEPVAFRIGKAVVGLDSQRNSLKLKSGLEIEVLEYPMVEEQNE